MHSTADRVSRLLGAAGGARAALARPSSATTLANLVLLAGAAVAGIVSARALGPAGRGQLALVVLWSALIHLAGSTGLHSSCAYHVARWPDRRAALAGWLLGIGARQAVVMTAASTGVLWWLHVRLGLPALLTAEYATWAASGTMALYGATYAQGCQQFARMNAIRILAGGAPAVLMVSGAVALHLTPAEAGAAYLVPSWVGAVLAWAWLRRASRTVDQPPLRRRERRAVWSYGWRSLASLSSLMLNNSSDQITLGFLVPAGAVGVYAVAASAATPLPALIGSLGMVGLPEVAALAGPAKAAAAWRTLRHAVTMLAIAVLPLALLLPLAIPVLYGGRYSPAVLSAEVLLGGGMFAALAAVTDDLLRAHGQPGFVSLSQGAGGAVTVIGTLLIDGRPLITVAFVSSLGFALAFTLALVRLWMVTRQAIPGTGVPDRVDRNVLANADDGVGGDVKVHHAPGPDHGVGTDPARADQGGAAGDPGARLDQDAPVQRLAGRLPSRAGRPEVVRAGQQHDVVAEEHVVADVHESAEGVYQDIGEPGSRAYADP